MQATNVTRELDAKMVVALVQKEATVISPSYRSLSTLSLSTKFLSLSLSLSLSQHGI